MLCLFCSLAQSVRDEKRAKVMKISLKQIYGDFKLPFASNIKVRTEQQYYEKIKFKG